MRSSSSAWILRGVAAGGLIAGLGCARAAPADLAVFGPVWTGDSARPVARAVAIRGDRIVAVGDSASVARLVGPATRRIDRPAGLVVPGLIDDHVHLLEGGLQLTSVQLRDAATPAELIRRIEEFAARTPPGEWILGGNWDHELWGGSPLPDRSWIDSVTPHNPVWVQRLDGHMGLANSLALAAAGMDKRSPDVAGGTIVRRPDGQLTGLLKDEASTRVTAAIPDPSPAQYDSIIARVERHAAAHGVTGVSSVSTSWAVIAALERARARGALTLRVASYLPLSEWRAVAESVAARGPGDGWLRTAGVKGLMDGSLGSTTAYFDDPYTDAPTTSGFLTMPEDSARRWIGAADSAGLQVAVHAIGDRANGLLLDIFDSVARAHPPRDRRFRIEHAQHLRPRDIPRFAALGVIPSMQPYHAADDGRWAEKRIGPVRIKTTYAFRSLLDARARLVFGSDWFVAPLDPILGIAAAVTRRTIDGKNPGGWVPAQKIGVDEALRAYTASNAYAMFMEQSIGRLVPGYQADLVILDRDLRSIPADQIERATVVATVVGGKIVYQQP